MAEGQRPLESVRIGNIEASIWESRTEKAPPNITIVRHYKDGEGNWKTTNSFNLDDLPVVEKVAAEALQSALRIQRGKFTSRVAA